MKYLLKMIVTLLLLSGCSINDIQPNMPMCEITDWGITSKETFKQLLLDNNQFSGVKRQHSRIIITKRISKIPVIRNISFGVEHKFSNIPNDGLIKMIITHPQFTKTDGTTSKYNESFIKASHVGTSWTLNRDWEQVPGKWKFEYMYNEKILCSKELETVLKLH